MQQQVTVNTKAKIDVDGEILEKLPGAKFRIGLVLNGKDYRIMGHISGKMRMHYIKLNVGDKVKVEVPLCDITKGRIIYRY